MSFALAGALLLLELDFDTSDGFFVLSCLFVCFFPPPPPPPFFNLWLIFYEFSLFFFFNSSSSLVGWVPFIAYFAFLLTCESSVSNTKKKKKKEKESKRTVGHEEQYTWERERERERDEEVEGKNDSTFPFNHSKCREGRKEGLSFGYFLFSHGKLFPEDNEEGPRRSFLDRLIF